MAEDLADAPFTVLAVALDEPEAARPWIEAAKASYPCLIDRDHLVADLYNLVNVPQAVWIDEAGRVVRPAETAGSDDAFRSTNRETGVVPPDLLEKRARTKTRYFAAVRDWVRRGVDSIHVLRDSEVAAALSLPGGSIAEAHAHFRLGRYLLRAGSEEEAREHMERASGLHPDSWAMWRQAAPKDPRGFASGPAFLARVDALGDKPYYPAAKIAADGE